MPFLASEGCFWPLAASMRSEVKKIYAHVITTTTDKDSIVWTLRMKAAWEPQIIIDKRGLFSLLFISDVDLADGTGRLTIICRKTTIRVL